MSDKPRWGKSLAIRLPATDEIDMSIAVQRHFEVSKDRARDEAIERLRRTNWELPPGFKVDREEANER